jgi:protein-L-isoaspartate(D-aspartate) O-methyltransferase
MIAHIYILMILLSLTFQEEIYKEKRERMVKEQIEDRGVRDGAVVNAMLTVKRHLFVPEDEFSSAYEDRPLPIGYGQTISQPYIVAYMTALIKPNPPGKVLEIGTGSGYQAAVLSVIVKEVYTVEIIPELGHSAAERLKRLGYKNVQVEIADGYYGCREHAPYDAIVVTAAAEYIPPPLIEQLKEGGKMVIPLGSPFMTQMLMLVEKHGNKTTIRSLLPVVFVPFKRSN